MILFELHYNKSSDFVQILSARVQFVPYRICKGPSVNYIVSKLARFNPLARANSFSFYDNVT